MKIKSIIIEDNIKEKILDKHNVEALEVKEVMLQKPRVVKSKFSRYVAIGYYQRYLTIVFELRENRANIITAYPSSEAQIKFYKKKTA